MKIKGGDRRPFSVKVQEGSTLMAVRFRCPQCGKKLKADPQQVGKRFQCTTCGRIGIIPRWQNQIDMPSEGDLLEQQPEAAEASPETEEEPIRFSTARNGRREEDMDMTPMVDVTFLLLIFFMLTASFAQQKALETPAPDPTQQAAQSRNLEELEEDDDYIVIRVDETSVVWVEDHEAPTRQELLSLLRQRRSGGGGPSRVLVTFHEKARHATVVMVFDTARAAGFEDIRKAPDEENF